MRTLHADLTTAQQAATATPYIELNFRSRSGSTTRSYKTTDSPNRILMVQQAEGRYGGQISVPGSQDIAAIIQLRDHDNSLVVLDWKGYRLDIAWGYNTSSGNRAIHTTTAQNGEGEPLYVVRQRSVSAEGELYLELECASLWGILNRLWLNRTSTAPIDYKRGTVNEAEIIEIVHELLGGATPGTPATPLTGTVVTQVDSGTYTSYATEAQDRTEDDVLLVPEDSSAVGDAVYFGLDIKFNRVSINLTQFGIGTWGIEWEYWNGAWTSLPVQPLNNRTLNGIAGQQLHLIDCGDGHLADWVAINLNTTGFGGAGPDSAFPNTTLFYIRARVSSQISFTTRPAASFVTMAMDFASQIESADEAEIGFEPNYESALDERLSTTLASILSRVRLRTVLKRDGFHTKFVDKDQVTEDYSYELSGVHTFFSAVLEDGPVIPNNILITNKDPGVAGSHEGSASDSTSIAAIGDITWVVKEESSADATEDAAIAQAMIDSLIWDTVAGDLEVPMNVGQEIWDKVEVIDSRSGETFTGFVSGLERIYEPGTYRLRIQMGGVDRIVQPRWLVQAQRHVGPAQDIDRRRREIQTARSAPMLPEPDLRSEVGGFTPRSTPLDPSPDFGAEGGISFPSFSPQRRLDTPSIPRNFRAGGVVALPLDVIFSPDEPRWANPVTPDLSDRSELVRPHTRPDANVLTEKILLYNLGVHQATLSAGTGGGPILTVEQNSDDLIIEWAGTVGAVRPFGVSKHPNLGAAGNYWSTFYTNQIALIDKAADPLVDGELQLNSADVKVFSGGAVRNLSDIAGGGGAPLSEPFVTIGNTGALSAERALTGTANQVIVTDNGVNSTVVLSTPQNIHTAANPTFAGMNLTAVLEMSSQAINDVADITFFNGAARSITMGSSATGVNDLNIIGLTATGASNNGGDVVIRAGAAGAGGVAGDFHVRDTANTLTLFTVSDSLILARLDFNPVTTNTFDLGSSGQRWAQLFVQTLNLAGDIDLSNNDLLNFASLQQNGTQATAGAIRLINTASILWRNAANSADIGLTLNSSDQFILDGPLISSNDDQDDLGSSANIWQDIFARQFLAHDAATVLRGSIFGSNSPSNELIVEGTDDVAISTDGGSDTGTITLNGFVFHPVKLLRKTSDETVNNSTTLQNDDSLSFLVAANETWFLEIVLFISSTAVADFKAKLTIPTGATLRHGHIGLSDSSQGHVNFFSDGGTANMESDGDGNDFTFVYYATVEVAGSSGTIGLQWAQRTAEVSNTIVRENSYLKASRL